MQILFEGYLHRDRLVNIGILPNVNSTKQKRAVMLVTNVCSRIIRLMNNQTKRPKKGNYSHKRRESNDKNAVAIVKIVPQLGLRLARLGSIGFSKWKTVPGKPDAKSFGINSKSTVHSVYATSSKYPGKERTIAWKNTSQTSTSAKSPYAMTFEDRSQEETARQERCAKGKAWNLAKNIYKLKENDKITFYSPAEEWVLAVASTKEPEERKFVVDSGASMPSGQQAGP